jgi:hypothetical protein
MRRDPKAREYIGLAMIVIVSAWLAMNVGRRVSHFVILRVHYGSERVEHEQLRVTEAGRVQLRISNGAVLGATTAKWAGAVWAATGLVVFWIAMVASHALLRFVAPSIVPRRLFDRGETARGWRKRPGVDVSGRADCT